MNYTKLFSFCATTISTIYSINNIMDIRYKLEDYKSNQLKELIADSCNYTYTTYIYDIKKDRKLTRDEKIKAMNITKNYMEQRKPFAIDINSQNTTRLIEDRLLYIKSLQEMNKLNYKYDIS